MFDIAHTHMLRANVPQITTSMMCHNETLTREYLDNRLHDDRQWKSDNAKKRVFKEMVKIHFSLFLLSFILAHHTQWQCGHNVLALGSEFS